MTRFTAKIGDDVTLEAKFTLDGDPYDPFEIVKVDLVDSSFVTVDTVDGDDVVKIAVGHYSVTFEDLKVSGDLCDHWHYVDVEDADIEILILPVTVADVEGTIGEDEPVEALDPDIGTDKVCQVSHTFIDAGGNFMKGVYVRFRPNPDIKNFLSAGTIAKDITAVSDENGNITLSLVKGAVGLLAISGIGLVREVEVPNVAVCPLLDLIVATPDLLEVQKLEFTDLPRRS